MSYLPEARKNIVEMIEAAMLSTMTEVQEASFSEPYADENLNLMLEAVTASFERLMKRSPNRAALLRTFALTLLDNTEK
jgi:hypothetical protein